MGITKAALFTEEQNQLAKFMRVMGHPARIAILEAMMENEKCVCANLVQELGLAQATVSQHLHELKSAGLIKGTVEGTSVCYCLHKDEWHQMSKAVRAFIYKGLRAPDGSE